MARLKFLAFAVVALGLWGYHLTLVAPLATAGLFEQAQAAVAGASGAVSVALESRRSLTQAAAMKVSGGPAAWNAGPRAGGKPEAPPVDRFASVRSAATDVVPAGLKEQLFIAVSNDQGVLWARGTGEPGTTVPEGLELAGVVEAGAAGAVRTIEGAPYLLFAVPLVASDKNEVKGAGHAVVGLPLLPDEKLLAGVAQSLGLKTIALVAEGKAVVVAGETGGVNELLSLRANSIGNLGSGPVRELGPLTLPMMSDTPHGAGSRQPIAGTPFEVVASASARAGLEALAGYQLFGLGGLAGLLLLSVVVTLLIGGGEEQGPAMVMPAPMPIPAPQPRHDSVPPRPVAMPLAVPEPAQEAPEASPDDFDFPMSSPSGVTGQSQSFQPAPAPPMPPPPPPPLATGLTGQNPLFDPEPTSDPFEQSAPPAPPPPARAPAPPPFATSEAPAYQPDAEQEDEGQRTVAYPAFKPPLGPPVAAPPPVADPFAMAAAQQGYDEEQPTGEENPESTRVAAVPAELLKAARQAGGGATPERPALGSSRPPTTSMPKVASIAPAGGGSDEDRHFQEVFRDFVSTREKCKEPADGLTYEKFKTKLLKNKEQLVAKYNCKSVRFQVYVKDGKAALKATPVKE